MGFTTAEQPSLLIVACRGQQLRCDSEVNDEVVNEAESEKELLSSRSRKSHTLRCSVDSSRRRRGCVFAYENDGSSLCG